MSNFNDEKPKFSKCKQCNVDIEWKPSPKDPSKRWPFNLDGRLHFDTCANKKPYIPKCKSCQQEIEWHPNPRTPGKNLPFNKDRTSHLDSCPNRKRGASQTPSMDEEPLF